ncbi:MAG: hypothetical protein AB1585_18435 [Thermodesulfobacteriota bacterium]
MKKTAITFCVLMALTLGFALAPVLISAAEFSHAGPPAFTVTFPGGSTEADEKTDPTQVWRIEYPGGFFCDAAVGPIPEGIALKDYAEKAYKPGLEKGQGANAKMSENKEITLSDGSKAFYAEISWTHPPTGTPIVTMIVAAYKDGKVVTIGAHPYADYGKFEKIVKSLKFK